MDVKDPTNITGISKLLDYDGVRNLDELEKNIIDDIDDVVEVTDVDKYKAQLEELGNALGVTLDDEGDDSDEGDESDESAEKPVKQSYGSYEPYKPKQDSYMGKITEEQKKQKILRHVLDGVENQKFSVEKEKEEDDKAILLEQIDMLTINLKDEGIDVSRVPEVNNHSPIEDIENVHKILRLKNDRNRYCSFAEECILAGSHTLEWLFDGKKTYMGRHPDLRGWSATVNIKLRRMRYDTSTFVSSVMQDYNLGHGARIMFELLPSLFLYSKMKKSQYADNLITSDEMNSAMDKIRDIEEKSSNRR
jgi:hypothetical protein